VNLAVEGNVEVRWKTDPNGLSSGVMLAFTMERNPHFLSNLFIGPSVILVVLAYSTFWID
jgi:hypothetical protein